MNSHAEYRPHNYQPSDISYSPDANRVPSHDVWNESDRLAHAADPSLPTGRPAGPADASSRRIAWVRPTELPSFTDAMVGTGIDLQAELIRRARRTAGTAGRAVRRRIHQAQRTSTRTEGIGL